jgi:serine/threonine-protein kinase/endoribonuclease IRE1
MKIAILWVLFSLWIITVLANGTRADNIETSLITQHDLILVSTIDGYLIAIDAETGQQKWRFKEGPIINSPRDALSGLTFIPNPRNGQLYSLENGGLGKLPFTIPEAVKGSPGRSNNGILYSGDKKDVWISINLETGTKMEPLPQPSEQFLDEVKSQCSVNVFIGRTEYHLKIFDTKNEAREWNVSFIDYSSHLIPGDTEYPYQHFTNDGKILTIDSSTGRIIWKKEFQSVIVNLYLLKSGGLQLLPSHTMGRKGFDAINEVSIFL